MAQTYSQGITGVNANARYNPVKTVAVGDTDAAGDAISPRTRSWDGPMMRGTQILCKNPDGSQSWYTIDAERSGVDGQLVMRPVGP